MRGRPEVTWIPVGRLGEVRMGKQLSPVATSHPEQSPYLRVANVLEDRIDYSDVKTMHFSMAEKKMFGLRPGDILLNEGQSIELVGRSAVYDGPASAYGFQNTLIRYRTSNQIVPRYAQLIFIEWLKAGAFARIARQTTSIAHLGADRFGAMLFPWIPLPDQRRVVSDLTLFDEALAHTRQQIKKVGDLTLGVIQTSLEKLPYDNRLGDILLEPPHNGYSPREAPQPTGALMLGLGCLGPHGFSPTQLKHAPATGAKRRELLADGDILISRANTRQLVGMVGRYRDIGAPCIYPDLMMRLRPGPICRPEFLLAALRSAPARRQIMSAARGTSESMVKISASIVMGLEIPLPPLAEQERILTLIDEPQRSVAALRAESTKLACLKQATTDALLPRPSSKHVVEEQGIIEA